MMALAQAQAGFNLDFLAELCRKERAWFEFVEEYELTMLCSPNLSYLSHYDLMSHSPTHISIHDVTTKYPKPADPRRLSICNLFHETHLIHMTTSQESR
jgi:hypothetical protein